MIASYETWLHAVFDHPESGPEWYWAEEFDETWDALGMVPGRTVEYLTRLFSGPEVLASFSLRQVAQSIWFMIGDSSPAQLSRALIEAHVPLAERIACVRAIPTFFRTFVAAAAPGASKHDADPFHVACYMWWDVFPTWGGPGCGEPEVHRTCLDAMAEVLAIRSDLCRISALHGLNHWHLHHARETEQIIDDFLARTPGAGEAVTAYARVARTGCAQ